MSDAPPLGTATLRTRLDLSGLRSGFSEAQSVTRSGVDSIGSDLGKLGQVATRFGQVWTVAVTAPLTAMAAVGVRSAMQLETFAASLEVLIGDAERANRVFEELYEFSAQTPFDWRTLSDSTRVLAAFGVEAEDVVGTLGRLGDIASGTQSDLTGLAEIYGRVLVTGRISMQEVNSLALRGVPIYTELAKVVGVSTEEVRNLISTGSIGFPQLQQVITNLTSEGGRFFGMMEAQAQLVAGRLATLKDTFEQVTDAIGYRFLPMFSDAIALAQRGVDWFNNLSEAQQGIVITAGTLAAAIGPVSLALGGLLTALSRLPAAIAAVRTGLALLRTSMLPFLGWAGLVITLGTAITGLALSLAGGDEDSLADAVKDASKALTGGDADSLDTAVTRVVTMLDSSSPVRKTLVELQAELRKTGDAAGEMADKFVEALAGASLEIAALPIRAEIAALKAELATLTAPGLAGPREGTALDDGRVIGGGGNTAEFLANRQQQLDQALMREGYQPGDLVFYVDEAGQLRVRPVLDGLGTTRPIPIGPISEVMQSAFADAAQDVQAITEALDTSAIGERAAELAAQLAEAEARLAAVLNVAPTGSGGGGGGGGVGVAGRPVRTAQDVLKELDEAGAAWNRWAAFLDTPEAYLEAASQRARLIETALRELITKFHGDVAADELRGLQRRQQSAEREAARYQDALDKLASDAERRARLRVIAMERAEVEGPGAGMSTGMSQAELQRAVADARARVIAGRTHGATILQQQMIAAREQLVTDMILQSIGLGPVPIGDPFGGSMSGAFQQNLRRQAERVTSRSASSGLTPEQQFIRDTMAEIAAEELAAVLRDPFGITDTSGQTLRRAVRQRIGRSGVDMASRNFLTDLMAEFLAEDLEAVRRNPFGGTGTRQTQRDRRAPAPPWTAAPGPEGVGAGMLPSGVTIPAEIQAMMDAGREARFNIAMAASEAARLQQDAAQSFYATVVQAGVQAGIGLVDAIRSGDVGSAISSLGQGAGSVLGALGQFGPAMGLVSSGAAGPLGLAAALVPMLAGFVGSLFNRRGTEEQAEAAERLRRQTPSIRLTLTNVLHYNQGFNLQDARTVGQIRRLFDGMMEDSLRRLGWENIRNAALGSPA